MTLRITLNLAVGFQVGVFVTPYPRVPCGLENKSSHKELYIYTSIHRYQVNGVVPVYKQSEIFMEFFPEKKFGEKQLLELITRKT